MWYDVITIGQATWPYGLYEPGLTGASTPKLYDNHWQRSNARLSVNVESPGKSEQLNG